MKHIEPSNEACLAVELYAAATPGMNVTPFGAARVAAQLIRLGMAYKRHAEHLCNYPDPGGRHERARERCHAAILDLLKPWGKRADLDQGGGGLCFHVVTRQRGRASRAQTWLGHK